VSPLTTRQPRRTTRRWADDGGFAGGAEALVFGVLIFVIGTLLVVNAWAVVDAKFATSAAAREAVRAAVETAPDGDPDARARAAAAAALAGHGLDPGRATVVAPWAGRLERCADVAYEVRVHVPALLLPGIERRRAGFDVRASHREVIDPFRSGLEIGGRCAF
jgi:hypothetical protein